MLYFRETPIFTEVEDIIDHYWEGGTFTLVAVTVAELRKAISVVEDRRRLLSDSTNSTETTNGT